MAAKLVSAAEGYPVSLAEAKAHLRVDFDDDDDLIEILIAAATQHAEAFTGRALIDQTWDIFLDEYPADGKPIDVPNPPLIEIEGVWSRDSAGAETEFAASGYIVDTASEKARVALVSSGAWPTVEEIANAVRVRFRAGYVNNDTSPDGDVPAPIKVAILLMLGHWYVNRETVVIGQTVAELPLASQILLRAYRVHTGMA